LRTSRALALLGWALALGACTPKTGDQVPKGTPVVLISIDTLRADHLPAWGYSGVETPAIDAVRRDGILYSHAYSQTPLTLPSHTSLLTGLLPGMHGVRDNVGYSLDAAKVTSHQVPYLPQMLKDAGYATGAGVSAYVLRGRTGLSTAFDFYEDTIEFQSSAGLGGLQRPGTETLAKVKPWLESQAGRPFFLFFHIYEPHSPYTPAAPFGTRYASSPYDGEIASADAIVGQLIDDLRRLGIYDRALVVLLSDHGEGLGQHGEEEHGLLLYNEDIHVPLLVKLPSAARAGATVDAPVQLADVTPTVAALLGLKPAAEWKGVSLLAQLDAPLPDRRIYSETFYPRLHFGWSDLQSLTDGVHHFIEGPAPELYDLAKDPGERSNILLDERRLYADMKRELSGLQVALAPPSAVDEETRQAMAALGYLGSGGVTSGPLPDPKSQLPALAKLRDGFTQMHEKRWGEAEQTFRGLVQSNPQMVDAWEFLGKALLKQGRGEEALTAYQTALERSGGASYVAVQVASILFGLERMDDAAAHAKLAMSGSPSFAHGLLARIALRRGDLATAESEARSALEDKSQRVLPLVVLAEVMYARHDYTAALDAVKQARDSYAEREMPDPDLLVGINLVEGKVHADLGDVAAAERCFREEIRLFPENIAGYSNLALLYALTGRVQEATAELRRMTEVVPSAPAYAEAARTYRALGDERGAQAILRYARKRFPESEVLKQLERAA
jgi:arylsulfatase A-like enzyme/cytochrome c-type biogenesis protein CcmH/NrfG